MGQTLPVGLLPIILVCCTALASAALLARWVPLTHNRYLALDGLRGFLAIFVVIHHVSFWYTYAHTGKWEEAAPSFLFFSLGRGSVVMFFMLTSFLFFTKLINGRHSQIDWLRLIVSRITRLTPAYLTAVGAMLAIIVIETGFRIVVTPEKLWESLTGWFLFVIPGAFNINDYPHTEQILAGVTWSLPYEWFFYLSLPLMAVLVGSIDVSKSIRWVIASLLCVLSYPMWHLDNAPMTAFLGGIAAAWVIHLDPAPERLGGHVGSTIALLCLVCAFSIPTNLYSPINLVLYTVALILIASGADLFGLLRVRAARALGQISYSIYLLHGLVLHLGLRTLAPSQIPSGYSYWGLILLLIPIIVGLSALVFRLAELPAMQSTDRLLGWLRSHQFFPSGTAAAHSLTPSQSDDNTHQMIFPEASCTGNSTTENSPTGASA